MNNIKTWQERMNTSGRRECESLAIELMEAEITDLRAALEAAHATPAQPAPNETFMESLDARILEATNKAFDCGEFQMDAEDGDSVTAYRLIHEKQKEAVKRLRDFVIAAIAPAKPSPSSVGDAIRAMPLPEPLEIDWPQLHSVALGCGVEDRGIHDRYEAAKYGWQDGVDKAAECVPEDIYTVDQVRELLSEAAALAEQALATEAKTLVPESWKLVPLEPTEAMIYAAEDIEPPRPFGKVYRAMLAAAPSIAQDGQKSEADHDA